MAGTAQLHMGIWRTSIHTTLARSVLRSGGNIRMASDKASPIEQSKRAAGFAAVDAHVKFEHRLIGIGSGSTVPYVVERIIQQGEEVNRNRWFVPTGYQSKDLIISGGLRLGDIDAFPELDVTLDGADECVDWRCIADAQSGQCAESNQGRRRMPAA